MQGEWGIGGGTGGTSEKGKGEQGILDTGVIMLFAIVGKCLFFGGLDWVIGVWVGGLVGGLFAGLVGRLMLEELEQNPM